jgi:DNA primase
MFALADEVRARAPIGAIVGRVVPLKAKHRNDLWGLCPFHGEKTPSFHVMTDRRYFHCFGCGAKGDVVAFVRQYSGRTWKEAVLELAAEVGLVVPADGGPRKPLVEAQPMPSKADQDREDAEYVGWCREQWRAAVPAPGTLVETYLRARGITMPIPPTIRFAVMWHSDVRQAFPCMVAAMQDVQGKITGIHRTYLRPDGMAKVDLGKDERGHDIAVKKMAGISKMSAIRLGPVGRSLKIGEGIETSLSVMQEVGDVCWAAGSLGNLAGESKQPMTRHPTREGVWVPSPIPDLSRPGILLPPQVAELGLLGDSDSDPVITKALMTRAERRYRAEGRKVRTWWAPPGKDFNDMLRPAGAA